MYPFRSPRFLSWFYPKRTWGFSSTENTVYLTFDDGPDPEATSWVLDFLKTEGIRATFFCVGSNVIGNPDVYQRILAEGHSVGNHTMNHENGFQSSVEKYIASVDDCSQLVKTNLFRPPYGRMTKPQEKFLSEYKIIMWSWLSYDFSAKVTAKKIIERAEQQICAGDILVFHDNAKTMKRLQEILPPVIESIRRKGLSFSQIAMKN
jgi:peptidoglycan/xylan/chitin deacetylase (PgdA/CDA1 family)